MSSLKPCHRIGSTSIHRSFFLLFSRMCWLRLNLSVRVFDRDGELVEVFSVASRFESNRIE